MPIGLVEDPVFQLHDPGSYHVESPQRLVGINEAISQWPGYKDLLRLKPRESSEAELRRVHRADHLELVASTAGRAMSLDPDTSTSPDSYRVALLAAGSLIDLCNAAVDGEIKYGLALIRPPGHHATSSRAMGFCLFNNVAVAAAHLISGRGLNRVMIVDWDVHHGNGTEDIFYADERVLYFSVHQSPFYPGTGQINAVGTASGMGFTQNLPLNAGHDDLSYIHAFEKLVKPLALAYKPEAILVSSGFDAHREDPLGGMRLSSAGYGVMTAVLTEIAEECCPGRIIIALEGGYSPPAMGRAVVAVAEGLGGLYNERLRQRIEEREPPKALVKALKIAAQHWNLG